MNIQIVDHHSQSTVIGLGALPRGPNITIKSSFQIKGWVESHFVSQGKKKPFPAEPFKVTGGSCLFDHGILVCFAGTQTVSNTVMLVLSQFQLHPKAGDTGHGHLNAPPSGGVLSAGDITWQIM